MHVYAEGPAGYLEVRYAYWLAEPVNVFPPGEPPGAATTFIGTESASGRLSQRQAWRMQL